LGKSRENSVEMHEGIRLVQLPVSAAKHFRQLRSTLGGHLHEAALWLSRALAARDWLVENARQLKIDVIETIDFTGPGAILADALLPPLCITCHGSFGQIAEHEPGEISTGRRALISLEWLGLATADALCAYSPSNARDWSEALGRNVQMVPAPWQSSAEISMAEQDPSATERGPLAAVVIGRLQSWKGCLELLEALRLARTSGIELRVEWIGADTETAPEARSMAGHLAGRYPELWDKSFRWTPQLERPAVASHIAAADIAIIPSRWETFSFAALEAMAAGKPLVISQGAGASYLCRDDENSLVVASHDAHALAAAMERMTRDPILRQRLGRAAAQTIKNEFNPSKILPARLATYEIALMRRARARARYAPPWRAWLEPLLAQAAAGKNAAIIEPSAQELLQQLTRKVRRKFWFRA
jgi:glycosyltransferase involved in cell wall biosynthesis